MTKIIQVLKLKMLNATCIGFSYQKESVYSIPRYIDTFYAQHKRIYEKCTFFILCLFGILCDATPLLAGIPIHFISWFSILKWQCRYKRFRNDVNSNRRGCIDRCMVSDGFI